MYDEFFTIRQLSEYYSSPKHTIETIIKRNRDDFLEDGLIIISGKELSLYKSQNTEVYTKISTLTLLTIKSKYRVAFMLNNNEIARYVRENLCIEDYKLYNELISSKALCSFNKKYENELGYLIDNLFGKYNKIEKQVVCGKYKIDFVINNNVAIECDENSHTYYNQLEEKKRELYILSHGYKIFRYNTNDNNMLYFLGEIIEEHLSNKYTQKITG